jgi:hypothetical protein
MALLNFVEFMLESVSDLPKKIDDQNAQIRIILAQHRGWGPLFEWGVDSIFKRQRGFATERQKEVLSRKERGDTTPYHSKN